MLGTCHANRHALFWWYHFDARVCENMHMELISRSLIKRGEERKRGSCMRLRICSLCLCCTCFLFSWVAFALRHEHHAFMKLLQTVFAQWCKDIRCGTNFKCRYTWPWPSITSLSAGAPCISMHELFYSHWCFQLMAMKLRSAFD